MHAGREFAESFSRELQQCILGAHRAMDGRRRAIFGCALGRAGFIPVDRKNRRTAVKSFASPRSASAKETPSSSFPEEGRSRARQMRPFQRGAFLLAIKAQMPMMPIAIDGTFDVFPVGAKARHAGQGDGAGRRDDRLREHETPRQGAPGDRLAAQIEEMLGVFGTSESRRAELEAEG
jgi:1-acyl-sn-glycerol-3-phosphate acyltransferase